MTHLHDPFDRTWLPICGENFVVKQTSLLPCPRQPVDTDAMTTDAKPEPADGPAPTQSPKRRWYQFSLRGMFVGVTVVAVLLTVGMLCIAPAQRQRTIVHTIGQMGAYVAYADPPLNENRLTTWMRDWLPQDYFDNVVRVDFAQTPVTDAGLEHLSGLTQLHVLLLYETRVTDAGLVHLSGLMQLQHLSLGDTRVTDEGLAHLSGLTQLQSLWLFNTQVTDAGGAELSNVLPGCHVVY